MIFLFKILQDTQKSSDWDSYSQKTPNDWEKMKKNEGREQVIFFKAQWRYRSYIMARATCTVSSLSCKTNL